ncbi:TIGR03435 family protein [Terriglobus albidus]|uniref:TIGR03435 family protein n=1 Tax=Terriglobus albidus TaxID=1592106 RepID=UPI0021E0BFA7|nr:TIGR03435 family protein [Terriglobus albidus]
MAKGILAVLIYGVIGIGVIPSRAEVHLQAAVGSHSIPQETGKSARSAFDVISVKPSDASDMRFGARFTQNGFEARNITPLMLIRMAYGLFTSNDDRFSGVPGWAKTDRFNISAKVADEGAVGFDKLPLDERSKFVQSLLRDRFHLVSHFEERMSSLLILEVDKAGAKIEESPGDVKPVPMEVSRGHLVAHGVPISTLATILTQQVGTTVVDKTNLKGKYDFTLDWTPESLSLSPSDSPGVSIYNALKEQLGLRLEAQKGILAQLVVDHLERPTEN